MIIIWRGERKERLTWEKQNKKDYWSSLSTKAMQHSAQIYNFFGKHTI
jgi:hypothetical protein